MKRSMRYRSIKVLINEGVLVCDKCRHVRKGEPYAIMHNSYTRGKWYDEIVCWRCCRDAESTRLIQQKWPVAFILIQEFPGYHLEWSQNIKAFVEATGETPKTT